jgi:hypothetical protein
MRNNLLCLFMCTIALSVCAADNYESLTNSIIQSIISQDSGSLARVLPQKTFRYSSARIDSAMVLQKSKDNFMVRNDGFYPYEKKIPLVKKEETIRFFTSQCGEEFNRKDYPVVQTDFNKVTIVCKNRIEIVLRALCDVSNIHLVFIRKNKTTWFFAGYFHESARVR